MIMTIIIVIPTNGQTWDGFGRNAICSLNFFTSSIKNSLLCRSSSTLCPFDVKWSTFKFSIFEMNGFGSPERCSSTLYRNVNSFCISSSWKRNEVWPIGWYTDRLIAESINQMTGRWINWVINWMSDGRFKLISWYNLWLHDEAVAWLIHS